MTALQFASPSFPFSSSYHPSFYSLPSNPSSPYSYPNSILRLTWLLCNLPVPLFPFHFPIILLFILYLLTPHPLILILTLFWGWHSWLTVCQSLNTYSFLFFNLYILFNPILIRILVIITFCLINFCTSLRKT